jgi:hypothetical protein
MWYFGVYHIEEFVCPLVDSYVWVLTFYAVIPFNFIQRGPKVVEVSILVGPHGSLV